MTGFGDAQGEHAGVALGLEIRSLNGRHLKAVVKLPDWLGFLEPDAERWLRRRLVRGSVSYSLKVRSDGHGHGSGGVEIDAAALEGYLRRMTDLSERLGQSGIRPTVDLATLMTLPGVCRAKEEFGDPEEWRGVVERMTERALDRLTAMRETEGAALWADLEKQIGVVADHLEAIAERAPGVVRDHARRLQERVAGLLAAAGSSAALAPDDLIREVAVFAEKADISEEIARLRGHIAQFLAVGRGEAAAGRKLEFLAQELHREANTIGSKANDSELLRRIVEVKAAVDRIKEQVQNVE